MANEMNENVLKFFARYDAEPELRQRIAEAEENYPGCLEIRDAVVQDILIPIAEELGLGFDLKDLRKYETKLKMERLKEDEADEDALPFWLLDRGWEDDASIFEDEKKKNCEEQ